MVKFNFAKRTLFLIMLLMSLSLCLTSCKQDKTENQFLANYENKEPESDRIEDPFGVHAFFNDQEPSLDSRIEQRPDVKTLLNSYGFEIKDKYGDETFKVKRIISVLTHSTVYNNDKEYRKRVLKDIHQSRALWQMATKKVEDYKDNGGFLSYDVKGNFIFDDKRTNFNKVDIPPHPESCQNLSKEELSKCTVDFISNEVAQHFVISNFKNLKPKKYRISVQFTINTKGEILDIIANGPTPELEAEAVQAVESLPKFIPGQQDDKLVSVLYTLPINFVIPE